MRWPAGFVCGGTPAAMPQVGLVALLGYSGAMQAARVCLRGLPSSLCRGPSLPQATPWPTSSPTAAPTGTAPPPATRAGGPTKSRCGVSRWRSSGLGTEGVRRAPGAAAVANGHASGLLHCSSLSAFSHRGRRRRTRDVAAGAVRERCQSHCPALASATPCPADLPASAGPPRVWRGARGGQGLQRLHHRHIPGLWWARSACPCHLATLAAGPAIMQPLHGRRTAGQNTCALPHCNCTHEPARSARQAHSSARSRTPLTHGRRLHLIRRRAALYPRQPVALHRDLAHGHRHLPARRPGGAQGVPRVHRRQAGEPAVRRHQLLHSQRAVHPGEAGAKGALRAQLDRPPQPTCPCPAQLWCNAPCLFSLFSLP